VLVGGFVENYMIWTEHGEKAPPPTENPLDKMIEDVEFARLFDAYYDDFCAGVGNDDVDGVSEGPIDIGSDDGSDDELDDGDFLSQLLRHTKAELLVGSAKGLANFEMVKKSAEEKIYERSNGYPKHWTVLCFILELLALKAKQTVVSIISCVCWLGCFQSQIKCPPTSIKQRSLPVRLRWVWKEFIHV
jgi:hypothetical protein